MTMLLGPDGVVLAGIILFACQQSCVAEDSATRTKSGSTLVPPEVRKVVASEVQNITGSDSAYTTVRRPPGNELSDGDTVAADLHVPLDVSNTSAFPSILEHAHTAIPHTNTPRALKQQQPDSGIPHPVTKSPPADRSHVAMLTGSAELLAATNGDRLVFVKFFSPRCPYCRRMAPAYIEMARMAFQKNVNVTIAEFDCTKPVNQVMCEKHVTSGFPTMKMFASGNLIDEYDGARDAPAMFKWVRSTAIFVVSPRVVTLETEGAYQSFLRENSERPVVIAAVPADVQPDLVMEWKNTVDTMRERSATSVAFSQVSDWRWLVGSEGLPLWKEFNRQNMYNVPPFALAASKGYNILVAKHVSWWFDGVSGGDALETFMHVATATPGETTLTPENAEFLTASIKPLVVVFGREKTMPFHVVDKISGLTRLQEVLTVYAQAKDMRSFREHLGMEPNLPVRAMAKDFGYVDLAVYRAPNTGVERVVRKSDSSMRKELKEFVVQYLQWGANLTERATALPSNEIPDAPLILADGSQTNTSKELASVWIGRTREATGLSWSRIVERDGRSVLLLLYEEHCPQCEVAKSWLDQAAVDLMADARSVFCARIEVGHNELPALIERPSQLPVAYMLVAGSKPVLYDGMLNSTDELVAFARYHAAPPHLKAVLSQTEFKQVYNVFVEVRHMPHTVSLDMLWNATRVKGPEHEYDMVELQEHVNRLSLALGVLLTACGAVCLAVAERYRGYSPRRLWTRRKATFSDAPTVISANDHNARPGEVERSVKSIHRSSGGVFDELKVQ